MAGGTDVVTAACFSRMGVTDMEHYVEVIGEGSFVEMARRFVAEVQLEVRAAKDEVAFSEVIELWGEALGNASALWHIGRRDC